MVSNHLCWPLLNMNVQSSSGLFCEHSRYKNVMTEGKPESTFSSGGTKRVNFID